MSTEDTIVAIATPSGEGGLAVVRLSGAAAFTLLDACFEPAGASPKRLSEAPTHTLHYGRIMIGGSPVDEVMVAVMKAPRSFTREDVAEVTCHGGSLPSRLVLEALLAAGARLAMPGEFTRRAFLNGRIDLAQAEAVADIIHSKTDSALRAANEQLAGSLSRKIQHARDDLLNALAHIEAHVDFPDEDIAPDTREALENRIQDCIRMIEALLETAAHGRILRQGIRTIIVGLPNAGKSSILNALLGHDRAIVSAIPGTTRDTIEETASIRGFPVVFVDTAGLRHASDSVEEQGIQRTRMALQTAELALIVIDASQAPSDQIAHIFSEVPASASPLVVLNKCDLPRCFDVSSLPHLPMVSVSCATGEGMESLKDAIRDAIAARAHSSGKAVGSGALSDAVPASGVYVNARHQEALRRAELAAVRTLQALREGASLELVALDLRIALNALGEIIGETTTEDLLDRVFSQFCIGK